MNHIVFLSIALSITVAAAANAPHQKCIIGADGKKNCVVLTSISPTLRASSCSQSDILCWNKEALNLVNNVRSQKGRPALTLGPQSQLDNAMEYASELAAKHELYHQKLKSATQQVRCQRWIGGENLAYNYDQKNAAAACVDQWINSKGHYENLVRERFEQVVLGLHFKSDGSVFCVQTFSSISNAAPGSVNDEGCGSISGSPSSGSTSAPSPTSTENQQSSSPTSSSSGSTEGQNACLCLYYSWNCPRSVASSSGGVCNGYTSYRRQGSNCVSTCCAYCSANPTDSVCQTSRIRRVC